MSEWLRQDADRKHMSTTSTSNEQNSSQPQARPRVWIHQGGDYSKVCADPVGGRNVGIIDHEGWISAKAGKMLTVIGREAGFTPSPKGTSRINGGSGYKGWTGCGSVAAAKDWLRERFDVIDLTGR
jgi:hypothetical protein